MLVVTFISLSYKIQWPIQILSDIVLDDQDLVPIDQNSKTFELDSKLLPCPNRDDLDRDSKSDVEY